MANKVFSETIDDPQPANGGAGTATAIAAGESLTLERDPITGRVKAFYSYAEAGKTNVVQQVFVVGSGSQAETRALALISSARTQVFGP
jgi:glycerate kinase